ncbi:sigma-54 interaction domain-containing protein [Vibrio fluminensis]|uniref:sigma-54 interaction domain-containing protein n=1 Tax=Vibrio fluminensis TaxID=2783614 RepID=UPI0018897742|nr:sigma 54-interacting transcriptional regulator [Vibrio fluminensis]
MSQWLAFSTQLVGIRDPHQLVTQFISLLDQEMELNDSLLLLPSPDGRNVASHDQPATYSWSVVDFDVPFAHVLQSRQSKSYTADELIFWRSNRHFAQLAERVGMFDSLRLQPLPMESDSVHSILVTIGSSKVLSDTFADDDFKTFLNVFSQQWSLLNEMAKKEQRQKQMKESLSDIQEVTEQNSLLVNLANKMIGKSSVMHKLRQQILSAASSNLSVMIQGETGTGKELVAQAIHDFSSRKHKPFVAVNCAAIPEHLLESELFGYCKGAFSGADSDKLGLIAQADGGTLFLDEIGDMPLTLQAKLLRVLEAHTFRPLGGKQELHSDFRLVSATHVQLQNHVSRKEFRQDLYYRLLQYPISIPSLAQRKGDLADLCDFFIQEYNQKNGTHIRGIHYQALDALEQYSFPGNVRELKHLIEFSCVQTSNNCQIELDSFENRFQSFNESLLPMSTTEELSDEKRRLAMGKQEVVDDLKQALNDFEAKIISERLARFDGDRAKTAESLGIPKRTLAYKCQKLEIEA